MTSLPTLRRKILRAFSVIVLLYAGFGIFLVFSIFLASSTTPKMVHINYDSIVASHQMKDAWVALDQPDRFSEHPISFWKEQFEKAIQFEEHNLTEPGEGEIAKKIREIWEVFKHNSGNVKLNNISHSVFKEMNQLLAELVQLNEKGMFRLTEQNTNMSRKIMIWAILYFIVTLILSLVIADGLAMKLSGPLKNIAEALQRRPAIGRRLKLIEPNSLELFILGNELKRLWDQVVKSQRINITETLQQKQKLETILESIGDAILVIDQNGLVTQSNHYLLSLIELENKHIKGHPWNDLPSASENYIKLRSTLSIDEMPDFVEIDLQHSNSLRHFSARSRKITAKSGTLIGTVFLLHDITEKKQKDKFRIEFVELLFQDLKQPLQSLVSASESLLSLEQKVPDEFRTIVEKIVEDTERIRAIANEFIQVTQNHSKILKVKFEKVPISEVLPEWIKPFRVVAKDRGVHLTFHKEGSEVIWANLDQVKFPWVISNLISNAIRFSPAQGEVEVFLTDRNGFVEIQVNDQSFGISDEDQKRLFESTYQSPMITTSGRKGLFGIGLSISREVVEAHDGQIEYYSRRPRGSEFRILLPYP